MAIPAPNSAEFDRLLDRLAKDITDAAVYRRLRADVVSSYSEYSREIAQSNTFWMLSVQAYTEMAMHRMSRVYAGHPRALTLASWLESIKKNPKLLPTRPAPAILDQDILSVKDSDPVVKKLLELRNKVIAHINWDNIAKGLGVQDSFALTFTELDLLIDRALEILNRYSYLSKQMHWSRNVVGHDDFRHILKAVRSDIERRRAQIEEERRIAAAASPSES